jgi:urease accessory protein
MLQIHQRIHDHSAANDILVLPFELRCRARFRAVSENGITVGLFLERGHVLDEGDVLISDCGQRFAVKAAAEAVVTATAADLRSFARACYHLGNRHVPLQLGDYWVRFQPDHILEAMVAGFGLALAHAAQPFRPEPGAYSGQGGAHQHAGHHDHDHDHNHEPQLRGFHPAHGHGHR